MSGYEEFLGSRAPIRAWVRGVPMEKEALQYPSIENSGKEDSFLLKELEQACYEEKYT